MNILAIISTTNFNQFTRRATVEAIYKKVERLDLLFFTSIKNFWEEIVCLLPIIHKSYFFWIPDSLKGRIFFTSIEHAVRGTFWKNFLSHYDVLFFTDPNQLYLLPYVGKQKIVYLIRDPNVLQNSKYYENERKIIEIADLILATSQNLAYNYITKYHKVQHHNVRYWPNCADLNIWDIKKYGRIYKNKTRPVIGMAGNINLNSDINLLDYISKNRHEFKFVLCGKIFLKTGERQLLDEILKRENVKHLGFINFEELPKILTRWNVGITIEAINEYTQFTHHNKVYQYLALGIPVVTLKIHDDYEHIHPYIQSVLNYSDYIKALDYALERSIDDNFRKSCIAIAKENSADKRAESFIEWVSELY